MVRTKISMMKNKRGRYSKPKSRSREPWERGRRAKKIGNPRYKAIWRFGKKIYILRKKN